MTSIILPTTHGTLEPYEVSPAPQLAVPARRIRSRIAYAACHVVADPLADASPLGPPVVDWEATLAFRHHVWRHGLGVAEAMDTAQRGMGLDWRTTSELIRRAGAEARSVGGRLLAGAGTDQLPQESEPDLAAVVRAYEEQVEVVEAAGSRVVIMASRHLARAASSPDDYLTAYGRLLEQVAEPAMLHWLGPMFDPALAGYWGHDQPEQAADTVLALCREHAPRLAGIKLSLLDADLERSLRRRLPAGVEMYTGDDYHYVDLIRGDGGTYSHALLGAFDPLLPVAAAALEALDDGDLRRYEELLLPTVPFSQHLFASPTRYYKTGVVFLAWLNGFQDHFRMVGGLESARSVPHLAELFRRADRAGVLRDPELATDRLDRFLSVAGVGRGRP